MLGSDSLVQAVNVFLVENLVQTAVAFGVVLAVMRLLRIQDPSLKIKLFLLPILIPLLAPPIYYLLFPLRREMPILALDRVLDVQRILSASPHSEVTSLILTVAILSVGAFLALKGALSVAATLYLPRLYRTLRRGDNPHFDSVLDRSLAKAGIPSPVVLLSEESGGLCCTFGLGRAYLLVSQGCIRELTEEQLESVLAHELAHVKRHDNLLSFALLTLRHLLFFNPFVHVLYRLITQEVESACDKQALSFGFKTETYAVNLLAVWRMSIAGPGRTLVAASHVVADRCSMKRRVLYLLDDASLQEPPRFARWTPTVLALALVPGLFFLC